MKTNLVQMLDKLTEHGEAESAECVRPKRSEGWNISKYTSRSGRESYVCSLDTYCVCELGLNEALKILLISANVKVATRDLLC